MKFLKKAVRLLLLTAFIVLASFGAAAMFAPNFRDRYQNKETRIELVDKKHEENEDNEESE
jgi:hypothetical protein